MREILFRGKDIVGNWYAGNLAVLEKDLHMGATTVRAGSYISNSCGSPFAYQIRPETVGQFTGLLDKNRKKIFEGDIVLIEGDSIGVIRYRSDEALFAVDFPSHSYGGRMTELMKRYEAETGKKAIIALSDTGKNVYRPSYTQWLEAQLRWRPMSEKPKEGQIVFARIQTGWVVAQYLHGEFYVEDGFTFGDMISGVTSWLPIPPAPEGERKNEI